MRIRVNTNQTQWDNRVVPLETTWEVFRDFILQGHVQVESEDRSAVKLFNGSEYKSVESLDGIPGVLVYDDDREKIYTRRLKENVLAVTTLILDYDGGMSIQDARERFKNYEYVGYTSFRHLKTKCVDKFRLVFPLASPIPAAGIFTDCDDLVAGSEWYELTDALKAFAGDCDPASFRCNQFFYLPIARNSRAAMAEVWANSGAVLDWSSWKRSPPQQYKTHATSASEDRRSAEHHLGPNQVLRSRSGSFRVRDVIGRIEGVWCPYHDDKHGSEFIKRIPTGDIFLYCRRCDKTYWMAREKPWGGDDKPLLTMGERGRYTEFTDASDRRRVSDQLKKIGHSIANEHRPTNPKSPPTSIDLPTHLVYLPEGSGKSALAFELASSGEKILFACKSWDQVFEKFEWFKDMARRKAKEQVAENTARDSLGPDFARPVEAPIQVQLFLSKGAKALMRFGVDPVRHPPKNPFNAGEIDDAASVKAFKEAKPELSEDLIRLTWHLCTADRLAFGPEQQVILNDDDEIEELVTGRQKFDTADIIVTTFAQVRLLRVRNQDLPLNWIVWFDDPDVNDLSDIEPYESEHWGEIAEDEQADKRVVRHQATGQEYFTRDSRQSLGQAVRHHKCVYTTTEQVTLKATRKLIAKRREYVIVHDEMEAISGGKITLLGTHKVYASYDGIIPLMVRRLEKEGHDVRLIADGLGQSLNHSNTKGKNDLAQRDLVVELSAPHPLKVKTICDTIGLSFQTEGREIMQQLLLDQLHQALGRNSGYRYAGRECVALVPANMHEAIVQEVRYSVDRGNSVIIDRLATMSRNDRRTSEGASALVLGIEGFLNGFGRYVQDRRKIIPDIQYVLRDIEDGGNREKYAARLLHSLTSLSDIRFDRDPTEAIKHVHLYAEYRDAADAVLAEFESDTARQRLLTLYTRRFKEEAQNDGREGGKTESLKN